MATVTVDLELPELQPIALKADDCALVIIDMENEFLKPEGRVYMPGRAERAIGNLAALIAKFRESGGKIIYVQSLRAETGNEFTVYNQPQRLIEDTWFVEIVDELKPQSGDTIVRKRSNDCFNHTAMEEVLAELGLEPGRSQIVVTGCATNVCVDSAVVGFSVRNYPVWVPEDCTASANEAAELIGYAHYFGRGFSHNVTPTRSDLIQLEKASA